MEIQNNKNILSIPSQNMPKLEGLGKIFHKKMLEHKDAIAHTDALTGETETYSEVLQKAIRVAIAMRSKGIKPNDIISICSFNALDALTSFYASFFVGAVPANLDPLLPLADMVYFLSLVRPKMIFVAPEAVTLIEDALQETNIKTMIVVYGENSEHLSFSDFLIPSSKEQEFSPHEVNNVRDTAVIIFSSGVTGLPKGISLSHLAVLGHMYQATAAIPKGTTMFYFSNLFWIAALANTVTAVTYGLNRLVYPRFNGGAVIWNFIKKYKIFYVSVNPHQITDICKDGRPADADTSSLELLIVTGGPVTVEQMKHFRSCFPSTVVINIYGQTELCGICLSFRPDLNPIDMKYVMEKPLSVGKPLPGYTYKVVDIQTDGVLGPNQNGELLIKSEYEMKGYYDMDSSCVWDDDGFMRSGDIVYYDEDYCFFIVDRVKELLKFQMWHISPVAIEMVFYKHPSVDTCVVTSRVHPIDGDLLLGLVILKEWAIGKVTEEELKKFVNDRVGEQKKLRGGVKFVKELPLTVTDKLSRKKIKQLVEQELI